MHRVTARRVCNLIARGCIALAAGITYLIIGWAIDKPGWGMTLAIVWVMVIWAMTLPRYDPRRGW